MARDRINKKLWLSELVLLCISLCIPAIALADIDDPADLQTTFQNFEPFVDRVTEVLADTLVSPVGEFVEVLFLFLVTCVIVGLLTRYVWSGLEFSQLLESLALIAFVRLLMVMYGPLTTWLWQWANAFGGGIQQIAVGSDDVFFVGAFMKNVVDRIALADVSIWEGITASLAVAICSILLFIISILGFLASAWPIWGYAVAKLTGWMFVPMILLKRTTFLFDGWLRLFLGFLMFVVFLRVNLSLTAIAFGLYFNLPVGDSPSAPYTFPVQNFTDFAGLACICFISIGAIWSTGKFAVAVAGGAGGGGDAIRSVAFLAGRLAR